jgi:hypothetical protein
MGSVEGNEGLLLGSQKSTLQADDDSALGRLSRGNLCCCRLRMAGHEPVPLAKPEVRPEAHHISGRNGVGVLAGEGDPGTEAARCEGGNPVQNGEALDSATLGWAESSSETPSKRCSTRDLRAVAPVKKFKPHPQPQKRCCFAHPIAGDDFVT